MSAPAARIHDAPHLADPATAANVNDWVVSHTSLRLAFDLEAHSVFGFADLTCARLPGGAAASHISFDVHKLAISNVQLLSAAGPNTDLPFSISPFTAFGSALKVEVASAAESLQLRIHFSADESCPAIAFLAPEQTADGTHPFLFTQGQAVLNRSLFPCQDTPGRRATWDAAIVLKRPYAVVMSALQELSADGKPVPASEAASEEFLRSLYPPAGSTSSSASSLPVLAAADCAVFRGSQPNPVPAYLIAFAAGSICCRAIGPRTRVWCEPSLLDKAVWEFGHRDVTEKYLETAERLYGAYRWRDYAIVLMPKAFPFGGMENPQATFANPALLTGDQSLIDVIAHELAHSWSGNLTTNRDWQRFSINEGFTMYLQRRLCREVDGAAITALETAAGRELLRATVRDYGASDPLTRLVVPLAGGVDPDETYTDVPYEKGFALVSYLRACAGSDVAFDAWLQAWFTAHSFISVTYTDIFHSYFAAFPHLRGDWSRERWEAEEAAEAASWFGRENPVPADLESCSESSLPPLPAADAATGAVPIVDEAGRRGLAYRPGYEFMRWLHAPGWPVFYPSCDGGKALSEPAEKAAADWEAAATAAAAAVPADAPFAAAAVAAPADETGGSGAAFASWPTAQKLHFLDALLLRAEAAMGRLPAAAEPAASPADVSAQRSAGSAWHGLLAALDAAHGFGRSGNMEVRLRWSCLVARAAFEPGFASIAAYFQATGKLKYVTPVMRALVAGPPAPATADAAAPATLGAAGRPGWAFALAQYAVVRPSLHPSVRSRVEGVLRTASESLGPLPAGIIPEEGK